MILLDSYTGQNHKRGAVFALGNFDGVHRGHRLLLTAAVAQARMMGVPAYVLTFEPHPRDLFQPQAAPFRLTPSAIKERLIKKCGIDDVVVCPFTSAFAQITAPDFVEKILHEKLGAAFLIAGQDFTFGHNRIGEMQKLAAWAQPHKIGVQEIALSGDGMAYSSSRIRELLTHGEVEKAAHILGRGWSMTGVVIKGAQRGRILGVPTANIQLGDYLRPKFGVYTVQANKVGESKTWRGVANVGVRPTVDGKTENLEAHLFDFNEEIYGQEWEFSLLHFLRPEQRFDSLDALKAQIAQDILAAKKL